MSQTQLNPYLNFDGSTRDAMEFYHSVLGGSLDLQTFGDAPMETPEEHKGRILHGRLESEGVTIMASDTQPGQAVVPGDNVNLSLMGSDLGRLTEVFDGLAQGGEVTMPLAEQFWGDTFGMLTDRFGIHWMVNVSKE